MGFIRNVAGAISDSVRSEVKDQYLEAFRTDSLGQNMLVKRAYRLNNTGRNKGGIDVISSGSQILVPEGAYALEEYLELLAEAAWDGDTLFFLGDGCRKFEEQIRTCLDGPCCGSVPL